MRKKRVSISIENVTAELVREMFDYNPVTGHMTWKTVPRFARRIKAGKRAGSLNHYGYRTLSIGNRYFAEHRVVWLHYYGKWPDLDLDHRDVNAENNAIDNLREASDSLNQINTRRSKMNKCGYKGVYKKKGRDYYEAYLRYDGKQRYLGKSEDPAIAHQMYVEKAIEIFGEFARAE